MIFSFPKISILILLFLTMSAAGDLRAAPLLDSDYKSAEKHDFISYFAFKKTKTQAGPFGLQDQHYYSAAWTSSLLLSVDKTGQIVHMKLGVPRALLDDEKLCTRGRDIVKSFVLANATAADQAPLKELADEIYLRGLHLQEIKDARASFERQGPGKNFKAYKVGKGSLSSGDNAIFLEKLPDFKGEPSPLFQVVAGKDDSLGRVYKNCRLAFINDGLKGKKSSLPLLWCESWQEAFWQRESKLIAKKKNQSSSK